MIITSISISEIFQNCKLEGSATLEFRPEKFLILNPKPGLDFKFRPKKPPEPGRVDPGWKNPALCRALLITQYLYIIV